MQRASPTLVAIASGLLLACAHTYGLDRSRAGAGIPRSASLYVALPEPGRYENQHYEKSGEQTRDAIASAMQPHVAEVQVGATPEDYEAALNSARGLGATHIVVPTIEHWEERATEWSGKPDRIVVKIWIADVSSGEVMDAAEISGKSRWATFGGDHPEELLPRAVGDYVALIFP